MFLAPLTSASIAPWTGRITVSCCGRVQSSPAQVAIDTRRQAGFTKITRRPVSSHFGDEDVRELCPASVEDRFIQASLRCRPVRKVGAGPFRVWFRRGTPGHSSCVQVLQGDRVTCSGERSGGLVVEVSAAVPDPAVRLGDLRPGPAAIRRPAFLLRERPLCGGQFPGRGAEKRRVADDLPVAGGSEPGHASDPGRPGGRLPGAAGLARRRRTGPRTSGGLHA